MGPAETELGSRDHPREDKGLASEVPRFKGGEAAREEPFGADSSDRCVHGSCVVLGRAEHSCARVRHLR